MSDGWTIRHMGIDWLCRTEQDALGVLCYLRDYGRQPLAVIAITPAPTEQIATLLATLPGQSQALLL